MFGQNRNNGSVVIFSVERAEETKNVNQVRTENIKDFLEDRGIPYKEIIGSYNGMTETSFIISKDNYAKDRLLRGEIFSRYRQDSVLHVDGSSKTAKLEYSGGFFETIGTLKRVTVAEAMNKHDNFSIDGNSAYIVD